MKRLGGFAIGLMLAATGCSAADSGSEAEDAGGSGGSKPVAVKAKQILKEFSDNELKADSKYKGKNLKVTGVVDKVDAELFDDDQYILRIGGGTDFELITVNCNDMSNDELSKVDKGQTVTVIGEFDDGGDLGVELKDCKLA